MKTHAFLLIIASFSLSVSAQEQPDVALVLETQSIDAGAIPAIEAVLGSGEITSYRLYAEVSPNWEIQLLFGDTQYPLFINSVGSFYQNANGGPTTLSIDPDQLLTVPGLAYDSWLTFNRETQVQNTIQILPLASIFDNFEAGGSIALNSYLASGIFVTTAGFDDQTVPDANGRILLGQFTTNGEISGCINMQFRKLNEDGSIFDPPGPDLFLTYLADQLCFASNTPEPCAGDLNNSGAVDIEDLLIVLTSFGCSGGCSVDLNDDGNTTSADVLILLSAFGNPCNS
jgi:hypothetical protein